MLPAATNGCAIALKRHHVPCTNGRASENVNKRHAENLSASRYVRYASSAAFPESTFTNGGSATRRKKDDGKGQGKGARLTARADDAGKWQDWSGWEEWDWSTRWEEREGTNSYSSQSWR